MTDPLSSHPQVFGTPNVIVRPPVLRPEAVAVSDEGEYVKITIGNSVLTLRYEDALRISQMIRVHAKLAKRRCGDVSRHWSVVGTLDGVP